MTQLPAYDFDKAIDRRGTGSLKFDHAVARGKSPDLLSLWVADMDFAVPREVSAALVQRAEHGIFGYTDPDDAYFAAVQGWLQDHHGWHTQRSWFVVTPGVVFALAMAVKAYSEPGDAVLIQQPVYYPFTSVIEDNGRRVVNAPLVYDDGRYEIDWAAFEHAITRNNVKLFLLCNPHNPGGRVWTANELRRLGDICVAHGVVVVSDEIHQDFARPGHRHVVFADLDERFAQSSVTCTSAGKTFNLAGLQVSNIVIPHEGLRAQFKAAVDAAGYSQPNTMGLVATQAAYTYGAPWLVALKEYLEGNWQALKTRLEAEAPELRLVESGSTYLAWIDCRALGLDDEELRCLVEDEAGLWLDLGAIFGPEGSGFIRINIATQRAYLMEAVARLTAAVRARE